MRARWILLAVAAGLLAGAAAVYVGLYRAADRRATEVRERAERDGEQHREALADYQRLLQEARGRAGELEELVELERAAGRAAADRARRAAERAGELGAESIRAAAAAGERATGLAGAIEDEARGALENLQRLRGLLEAGPAGGGGP
jgi:hypothetical protein